ncbi:MAG: hypothetical protein ACREQJ_15550, partial [Candidatus Binatia bacterium]
MSFSRGALPRLAAAAALGFAIAGQWRFSFEPKSLAVGAWLWLAAVALALLSCGRRPLDDLLDLERVPVEAPVSEPGTRAERLIRASLAILGLAVGAAVVFAMTRPPASHWPIFAAWIVALVAYAAAFVSRAERRARPKAAAGLALAVIVAVGFALRATSLESIPWSLGGDEASQGLEARRFLTGGRADVLGLGWFRMPNLSFLWPALWMLLVGDDTTGLRLGWAVIGTASLPGFYLLAARLF